MAKSWMYYTWQIVSVNINTLIRIQIVIVKQKMESLEKIKSFVKLTWNFSQQDLATATNGVQGLQMQKMLLLSGRCVARVGINKFLWKMTLKCN